ncbi:solute carrier organic anion transporter family member 6C1-like [Meriones unguiculatus]|uniref:solute carrier organic anion transporter family member 6C1-like n=1 Tax=Meriones unguiculatus TaxID=10047 RepID=UPI00293EA4E9|nr:solute carrier organic anion transporter family member 6C1-like [Meriones unguiculatus]
MDQEEPATTIESLVEEIDDKEHMKTLIPLRTGTYLQTFPTAFISFSHKHKQKNVLSAISPESTVVNNKTFWEKPFGLGPLVVPALQRFNNIDCFTFLFVLSVFSHGMIVALTDLSLPKYQAEFSLSSLEKFMLEFSDYFASFLVAIPVSYFGSRGNRAKWVAVGSFLLGVAAIMFAVPYLKYEIIRPLDKTEDLCTDEHILETCEGRIIPHRSICIHLFFVGQCLHGISGMSLYILGVTFIFDHVPSCSVGFYLAIVDLPRFVGYTLGYTIGFHGLLSPENVTVNAQETVYGFRQWQQPWWIAYLVVVILSWAVFLPLFCFPSSLPGAQVLRLEKENEPPTFDQRLKDKEIGTNLKDIHNTIQLLLKNTLLMTQIFCKAVEFITSEESSLFVPVYLESQFMLTPSLATVLTGLIILPGTAVAHFMGGLIVDRLEMNYKTKVNFTAVTTVLATVFFTLIFFVECETVKSAGINEDYDGLGVLGNLTAPCNEYCGCTSAAHTTICGRDDTEYFSPCFAGCKIVKDILEEKTYYNCSCIKEGLTTADIEGHFIDATIGKCNRKCHTLPLFFAFYFSSVIFGNLCSIPVNITILKSVPSNFSSLSMGLTFTILKIGGVVTGPLLFQGIQYVSCIYWNIDECGIKGHCWIFNKIRMVTLFMAEFPLLKLNLVLPY